MGFRGWGGRASLARANGNIHCVAAFGPQAAEGDIAGSKRAAEARRRAEIVLLSAAGAGTNEVMRRTGKSKPGALRWQEWFMREGVAGLLGQRVLRIGRGIRS
jgi:hypothetical protein